MSPACRLVEVSCISRDCRPLRRSMLSKCHIWMVRDVTTDEYGCMGATRDVIAGWESPSAAGNMDDQGDWYSIRNVRGGEQRTASLVKAELQERGARRRSASHGLPRSDDAEAASRLWPLPPPFLGERDIGSKPAPTLLVTDASWPAIVYSPDLHALTPPGLLCPNHPPIVLIAKSPSLPPEPIYRQSRTAARIAR